MTVVVRPDILEEMQVLRELERRKLENDFATYTREAWKIVRPFENLIEGWYLDAVAEYLQAIRDGQITRLIINQPPRTLKSTQTTIMFPTWVWATMPWWRFIFYSYSFEKLATPHSISRRHLMLSDWYQERWSGMFKLSYDENMKWMFSNTKSGRMEVLSQATGSGGNCLIIDDPHSVSQALSDAERETGVQMVRQGLLTRLDTPLKDPVIVVMQRLHEKDVSGSLLEDKGWTHLCLPAEAEAETKIFLPITKKTMVRKKGDLLDPIRLNEEVLTTKKRDLGPQGYAGQYQQTPTPSKGLIFETTWWRWWDPTKIDWRTLVEEVIVSVDTAVKDKETGSDVAIQAWGIAGIRSYLLKRDTQKRNFPATKAAIRTMMDEYGADLLLVEDKSNGPAIMSELKGEFHISAFNPDWGDKVARARACSSAVYAGDVYLPENSDGTYIQRVAALFPAVEMKDDIDAMTQFLNWRRNRGASMGWMKAQAEAAEKEAAKVEEAPPPTAKELHQAANEAAGLTKHTEERKTKSTAIPTRCKFCDSENIFVGGRGVKCNNCGKRWDFMVQEKQNEDSPKIPERG